MLIYKYSNFLACAVPEPCSRLRKDGGAASESFGQTQHRLREFAPQPESANRAGNPKRHDKAKFCMVRLKERDRC